MTNLRRALEVLARPAWLVYAIIGGAIAILGIAKWIWAVTLRGPVIYGEGAVAHAATLARNGIEYTAIAAGEALFVAANYTPLYFHLASVGDPFVSGRVISLISTLFIAASIAWRARAAGRLVAASLSLGWLALAPVLVWAPTVKPDLLSIALTVAAVLFLERSRRYVVVGAVLMVLAVMTKPTAVLPALAIALWFLVTGRRVGFGLYAGIGVLGGALLLLLSSGGPVGLLQHVVTWNELDWSLGQAVYLAVLGLFLVGVTVVVALAMGSRGAVGAHLAGALVIVALGGREGATINYLLEASAAGAIVLATFSTRLRWSGFFPLAAAAQLVVGFVLFDPFGVSRPALVGTGSWDSTERYPMIRDLPPGDLLVEDSGLLIIAGRKVFVDDLFLWSRLVERGALDPEPVLEHVREKRFVRIVSEVDLSSLGGAPAYKRQRWAPLLTDAVLTNYELVSSEAELFVYRPR